MRPNWLANLNANKAASVLLVLALAVALKTQAPPGGLLVWLLPFLFLGAFGANVAWMVTIYFNCRLFLSRRSGLVMVATHRPLPTEVEK
jgi:hypothetical protein